MDAFTHSFGSNTSFDSHGGGIHHMAGIDDDSLICKHVDKQNQYILLQNHRAGGGGDGLGLKQPKPRHSART
jgi:hypothetical protein